jgi:hypothetical protein
VTENSFTPLPPGTTAWKLSLRFSCQAEYQLTGDVEPAELSEWIKVARTRRRWVLADSARLEQVKRALQTMEQICGANFDRIKDSCRRSGVIEIGIPYREEHWTWLLPWELILTSLAISCGARSLPIVVRHIEDLPDGQWRTEPATMFTVKSNPGVLGEAYSSATLDSEEAVMHANLDLKNTSAPNYSLAQLKESLCGLRPDVIHLVGVDIHQGRQLEVTGTGDPMDGMVLGKEVAEEVGAKELAGILSIAHPLLVGCNFYNSAARVGAELVAAGARVALGIQDSVTDQQRPDDYLSEIFFANFYLAWRLSDWDTLDALRLALTDLSEQTRHRLATGIVLWTSRSLLQAADGSWLKLKDPQNAPGPSSGLSDKFRDVRETEIKPDQVKGRPVEFYAIEPLTAINCSLLQNQRPIFRWFVLHKKAPLGMLRAISVEVTFDLGQEPIRWETTADMMYGYWDLSEEIRLPLTSRQARSNHSILQTSLLVRVSVGTNEIFRQTYSVRLLPIEQWQDDDDNRCWLPSFILPDDSAVIRIIDNAQRYLFALADDASAGFAGYQENRAESVNNQVRAIWWALTNDISLNYVNPLPAYSLPGSQGAQRIRTPSEMLKAKRGTCLDVSLLFASCLEYIDLEPVVFLLQGHALPGYLRDAQARPKLQSLLEMVEDSSQAPWMFGKECFGEIRELLDSGDIVPVETIGLNSGMGFWTAVDVAGAKIRREGAFEYLLDLKLARENGVTSLPIYESGGAVAGGSG